MSKSSNISRTIGLFSMLAVCVALVCADLDVSSANSQPQNTNSSTTQEDETTRGGQMTSNSNATSTSGRRRRGRRRSSRSTNANANMSGDMTTGMQDNSNANMSVGMQDNTNANMSGTMSDAGTQTDLSGTYTGNVNYPEGGISGPATLTITGNQFTLTPEGGGTPVTGTVTAVTTRGYTGVTMMFGDRTPPPSTQAPPPLPAVSLRARMAGGRVTLTNVPGEKRDFSFSSGAAPTTPRGRRRRPRSSPPSVESPTPDMSRGMEEGIKPPTVKPTP